MTYTRTRLAVHFARLANEAAAASAIAARANHPSLARQWRAHAALMRRRSREHAAREAS